MYGYEIVQTLIVDIEPDEQVKRAMNEINAGKFEAPQTCCPLLKPKYAGLFCIYTVQLGLFDQFTFQAVLRVRIRSC
jgi:hypothetical protein